jgi:discoidin domain receptor family protein 2
MPQGDKRGSDWEFFDAAYDGPWDGELRRGLGQLIDGKTGPDNFKLGFHVKERGKGWVGWRNDTRNGQPIEIKFEFDRIREFSAVHIFSNNQFSKDVKVSPIVISAALSSSPAPVLVGLDEHVYNVKIPSLDP